MISPLVRFRAVVALIDRFPVLAGIDLDAEPGEIVLLRGPNGAGKTSLLRVAAGLLPVASGEASVLGVDIVRDRKAVRARVGFLAHETMLYGELTPQENVDLVARALGTDRSAGQRALQRVGLSHRVSGLPVDRLSAGQRRRVALAALVVRDPMLWLLDEPHTGLDHDSRALLDELVTDAAAKKRSILFSSHEVDRVKSLAHRELHIVNGIADATPVTSMTSTTSATPATPAAPAASSESTAESVIELRSRADV